MLELVELEAVQPTTEELIPRHGRDGRPKIWPEDPERYVKGPRKGQPRDDAGKFYTRVTTFVDALDDKSNLATWESRKTAQGLGMDVELVRRVQAVEDPESPDGKKVLDAVVKAAKNKADADLKSKVGTAIHKVTEQVDLGLSPFIPPQFERDLEAYVEATKDFEWVGIEEFVVIDGFNSAGTFDRLGWFEGCLVVADVKTGRVDYGVNKMRRQMAGYSRGRRYDPFTFARSPLDFDGHPVDLGRGYIIHLPAGEGRCDIIEMNLHLGWAEWPLCEAVRKSRRKKDDGAIVRSAVAA